MFKGVKTPLMSQCLSVKLNAKLIKLNLIKQVALTNPNEDSLKSLILQGRQSHFVHTEGLLAQHLYISNKDLWLKEYSQSFIIS